MPRHRSKAAICPTNAVFLITFMPSEGASRCRECSCVLCSGLDTPTFLSWKKTVADIWPPVTAAACLSSVECHYFCVFSSYISTYQGSVSRPTDIFIFYQSDPISRLNRDGSAQTPEIQPFIKSMLQMINSDVQLLVGSSQAISVWLMSCARLLLVELMTEMYFQCVSHHLSIYLISLSITGLCVHHTGG